VLLSDGQRVFAWDAEDRLVGTTWPAQPGKQVTFAYDGQGRRTTISSTPAGGGGTTTTSYVWCGASLCQVRNAANAVTRAYYDEGEFVPGAPAQRYYYGADQIGSVRRVFASTGGAPAYGYDPYGVALQGTAPLTDFGFAGMFWHADSGLYLTQYRAYDPVLGRWLSRDPLGEGSDRRANLYAYVGGNPVTWTDPSGLLGLPPLPLPPTPGGGAECGPDDASNDQGNVHEAKFKGLEAFFRWLFGGSKGQTKPPPAPAPKTSTTPNPPVVVQGTDKQWGQKFGQHGHEAGAKTHHEYRDLANKVRNDPQAKVTKFPPDAPRYRGETHYQSGDMLLRLDPQGNFRSLYPLNVP
jgi:RHS repeat-associated protein